MLQGLLCLHSKQQQRNLNFRYFDNNRKKKFWQQPGLNSHDVSHIPSKTWEYYGGGRDTIWTIGTLLGSGSEWPKDRAYLLMQSRYARNLYKRKMKRIFEITSAHFEIILFIHLNNQLDRARSTLWINFIIDYCLPLQMNTFGHFDFHAMVKKCHFGNFSERLIRHFLTHAWKSKFKFPPISSFCVLDICWLEMN